jgi:hypothetical protein
MRGAAMDPRLVSLVSEFLLAYLPEVRKLDDDTVASYRNSINCRTAHSQSHFWSRDAN